MLGGGGGDAEQHKATAQGQGGELGRLERSELLVSPSPRAPHHTRSTRARLHCLERE